MQVKKFSQLSDSIDNYFCVCVMKVKANDLNNTRVQQKSTKSSNLKGQVQKTAMLNNPVVTERVAGDAVVSKNRGVPTSQKGEKIKDFKDAKRLAKGLASELIDSETLSESHDISFASIRHLLFE